MGAVTGVWKSPGPSVASETLPGPVLRFGAASHVNLKGRADGIEGSSPTGLPGRVEDDALSDISRCFEAWVLLYICQTQCSKVFSFGEGDDTKERLGG